ncbi:peptide chain release factor H [Agarilytica rhodophyticola]|uniref:peptide chain release factor H n=1 Tax=Agarilytica rhodophyticola TaxID=1737490 RepID=UPI000B3470AD|nr:peptide chain release factor H [Agarilytica rhodophyticola]
MEERKNKKDIAWIQITAGQGPKECGWVVAQTAKVLLSECESKSIKCECVEYIAFDKMLRKQDLIYPDTFLSMIFRLEGYNLDKFLKNWHGSIKWHGESPYRPGHKRINWFVGVMPIVLSQSKKIDINKLLSQSQIEFIRSKGPGGQHVNKTNSAVRLTHRETGIQIRVDTDRSQHRNKQLALERLHILLSSAKDEDDKKREQQRWLNHYGVQRGKAIRTFKGPGFQEI